MAGLARKITPLADRVLIKKIVPVAKTAGGILLPENNVSKTNEGEVLAVGPGYKTRDGETVSVPVTVGDKVILPEYGGTQIKFDNEELYLFRSEELLALLK